MTTTIQQRLAIVRELMAKARASGQRAGGSVTPPGTERATAAPRPVLKPSDARKSAPRARKPGAGALPPSP
jgi:hypothetical protein